MAQTMRRTLSNLAIGLTPLLLAAGGTLRAQVNPATVKNQAQKGVNQAQQTQSTTQGQAAGQTPTPPKKPAQSAKGQQGTAKPGATQGQQPPKTPGTKNAGTQNQKKAPVKTPPPKTGQTPPKTAAKTPEKKPETGTAESVPAPPVVRRDPFVTLIGKQKGGASSAPVHLPPGKAGLQVNTLVIEGILSSPTGMIAIVANPQRSVYFLHAGDELFDGRVEKIDIDGVTFHEVGKDAFGKPLERQVTRKLNPSLGEQP